MEQLQTIYSSGSVKVNILFVLILLALSLVVVIFQPLIVPLLISFSLYALFVPVNAYFIRKGCSENLSALLVVVAISLLFFVILSTLSTPVKFQFQLLIERFPIILNSIETSSISFLQYLNIPVSKEVVISFINSSQLQIGELAITHGSNFVLSVLSISLIVPLITFFLIKDYRRFRSLLLSKLPNASFELGWIIYYRVVKKLQNYIRGILLQSLVVAIVCSAGFLAVGFESYILLGVLAGVFNIIPYVGPLLAMILPVLIVISEVPFDFFMLFMAIGVVLLAQFVDNVFVIPLVIANSVNMHPLVVILGLIIFGSFFGLIGMVIAIPVMVTVNIIYSGLQSGLYVKNVD
jgi:predicted PurR-regulated permease PerM